MTDATPTTSACRDEGQIALSSIEAAFLRLSRTLDTCVAAERHLLEVDAFEYDEARVACEAAGETLTTQLGQLLPMADEGPADRSLRRLSFMLNSVLSIEHDADRAHFAASLLDQAALFEVGGRHPASAPLRDLGWRCIAQVSRLIDLRDTITADPLPEAEGPGLAA
jgi:hypothetical protein